MRHKLVLFGGLGNGYLDDTWEFDGANWQMANTLPATRQAGTLAMAFDSRRGVTVLFGGYSPSGILGDTWEYDGAWRLANPAKHRAAAGITRWRTTAAAGSSSCSVAAMQRNVSGGNMGVRRDDMATEIPAQSPPPREQHGMAFDSPRGVVVISVGSYLMIPRTTDA